MRCSMVCGLHSDCEDQYHFPSFIVIGAFCCASSDNNGGSGYAFAGEYMIPAGFGAKIVFLVID